MKKDLSESKEKKSSGYKAKNHSVHQSTVIIFKFKIGINDENAVIPLHA
ncbi:hypothetical protein [Butyrivibrio fibrisolvens]|nr:hypothetical protein [Butyrivibrio fibrisolvens]